MTIVVRPIAASICTCYVIGVAGDEETKRPSRSARNSRPYGMSASHVLPCRWQPWRHEKTEVTEQIVISSASRHDKAGAYDIDGVLWPPPR
jgi:hypothetical protein